MYVANNAIAESSTATVAKTSGSEALTPKSRLDIQRVSPKAAPTPMTTPMQACPVDFVKRSRSERSWRILLVDKRDNVIWCVL